MQNNFSDSIWQHYNENKRAMPWRELADLPIKDRGYRVLVSEVMLQQTQVNRVIEKYQQWMQLWPTIDDFVEASLSDVLVQWNGLGYNRRAKYLHETLQRIHSDHNGIVPKDTAVLQTMPGIGPNTAAAIIVYTYNLAVPFIETNIRTVYIHAFFADTPHTVTDKEIYQYVEATLDHANPREWYYALMDYGAYLKKNLGGQLHKAKAHKKQTAFKDSKRQVRGKVIRLLTQLHSITRAELAEDILDDRLDDVISELVSEGLLYETHSGVYELPNR